ncbi:hypothetical protein [Psychrobacter sp. DAB_AL32B]|uniref:hypothetical protein n=1 Tax=Psychrobacter sp. DAB_AL32B TaxID=1028414 RepID=UPI000B7DC9F3|nr:hypothetical protein [Psychrobacter sp. DAB_AL32B]OXL25288.1 hypothetical protein CAN34_04620 [Psychrobacter sp. DAB_AL32B]
MDEVTKGLLANQLITQTLVSYLIKTGVIDEVEYIEHAEVVKYASMQRMEQIGGANEILSKEIIKEIFDEHLSFIRDND